jgi:hypothetical protein
MQAPCERGGITPTLFYLGINGGEWSASRSGRALPPGMDPPVPIGEEAEWASELVWTQILGEQSFASAGD